MAGPSQTARTTSELTEDQLWGKLVEKGAGFVSRMEKGPHGESKYKKYENLQQEGWIQRDCNTSKPDMPFLRGPIPRVNLAGVLESLKVSHRDKVEGGENNYQALRLDRSRLTDSQRALIADNLNHGNFENSFNPRDGVILCHKNFKPKEYVYAGPNKRPVGIPRPELINWSDMIFLQWEHFAELANCDVRNLRYVFRSRIDNEQTLMVIRRAISAKTNTSSAAQASGGSLPGKWPGLTFRTDTDEGRALLATPNAKGIARGIFDRPEKYQGMVIKEIQVFEDDPIPSAKMKPMMCMLIRIVDRRAKQTPKAPVPSQQKAEVADKNPSKFRQALRSTKERLKEDFNQHCRGQSG